MSGYFTLGDKWNIFGKQRIKKFMFDEKSKKFILQKYKVLNFEL